MAKTGLRTMFDSAKKAARWSLLLISMTLFDIGGIAAEQQSQAGAGREKMQDTTAQSRQPANRNSPPRTVKPYVPSEKVSADKTVSFPVDI